MVTVFVHRNGRTEHAESVDPAWIAADSGVVVWVDLSAPTPDETRILSDIFHFHPLSVEDALSASHAPKVEGYESYLYLILHGIDFQEQEHLFATRDIDFFVGERFLVTVHDGVSRSVARVRDICEKNTQLLAEGPVALLHRIIDQMVDNYEPEVEELEDAIDALEKCVFEEPDPKLARRILGIKRDVSSLRRVTMPQRDAIGRLARREFPLIDVEMAYRFRDVHDHLVRLADESMLFHDRLTGVLDAHLSNVSNQLNRVMKVLTIITTIFGAWTMISGFFGMNVPPFTAWHDDHTWRPMLGVAAGMTTSAALMVWIFRRKGWF